MQIAAGMLTDQWANPSPVNGIKVQIDYGKDYDVFVDCRAESDRTGEPAI